MISKEEEIRIVGDFSLYDSEQLLFIKKLSCLTIMVRKYLNGEVIFRKINQTDLRLLDEDIQYIVSICDSAMIRDYNDLWIGTIESDKSWCVGNPMSTNYDLYYASLGCIAIILFSLSIEDEQPMISSLQSSISNLLKIWTFISTLEEFDHSHAVRMMPLKSFPLHYEPCPRIVSFFQIIVVELIYTCWIRHSETSATTRHAQTLLYLKRLVHWSYVNSAGSRREWRLCLGNALVLSPLDLPTPMDDFSNCRRANILSKLYPSNHQKPMKARPVPSTVPGPGPGASGFFSHIQHLLELLLPVVDGIAAASTTRQHVLEKVLLPLHCPNDMVLWRDQVPVLQEYHELLVRCTVKTATGRSDLLARAIRGILDMWPDSFNTNTPKQVLLLHELETLLLLYYSAEAAVSSDKRESLSIVWTPFWVGKLLHLLAVSSTTLAVRQLSLQGRFARCIGSDCDNIRPAQRALQFFKNDAFLRIFAHSTDEEAAETRLHGDMFRGWTRDELFEESIRHVLPALYRGGVLLWNPTVNRMTAMALSGIKKSCGEPQFKRCCGTYLVSSAPGYSTGTKRAVHPEAEDLPEDAKSKTRGKDGAGTDAVTAAAVVGRVGPTAVLPMRPPIGRVPNPAVNKAVNLDRRTALPVPSAYSRSNPPPLEVTGVAPWAIGRLDLPSPSPPPTASTARQDAEATSGYQKMVAFMEKCLPADEVEEASKPNNEWIISQSCVTPTLLPDLKFFDLVFGRTLGEGAFSTVKYSRQIIKSSSQSKWPEYAVKICHASKIAEVSYMNCCLREMAALQLFSHPNIARLVSCFQYNASAYLVLEYASAGDLHTLLVSAGKLAHSQTRFVLGEVVAALQHIHDLGFSFNDLKPENILITALGHIKLTDFGGCRPVSAVAKSALQQSRRQLRTMRSGDWRDPLDRPDAPALAFPASGGDEVEDEDDLRIECTPSYSPPELLERKLHLMLGPKRRKYTPTNVRDSAAGIHIEMAADAWGVGCVGFFCLKGRPLFYGDEETVLRQIDDLAMHDGTGAEGKQVIFARSTLLSIGDQDDDDISRRLQDCAAESFLKRLLNTDVLARATVFAACEHDYLRLGYLRSQEPHLLRAADRPVELTPLYLHSMNPVGSECRLPAACAPISSEEAAGSGWQRRQFSVLWAPMPPAYSISDGDAAAGDRSGGLLGSSKSNSYMDMYLATNHYTFSTIPESNTEEGAPFV